MGQVSGQVLLEQGLCLDCSVLVEHSETSALTRMRVASETVAVDPCQATGFPVLAASCSVALLKLLWDQTNFINLLYINIFGYFLYLPCDIC